MAFKHGLHFLPLHHVYLAGVACHGGLRVQAQLDKDEKISGVAWPLLPQEQRAGSEGALRGGRGPDANQTEVEAALASSQAQSELGSRVEHGRDLRCCIAPRRQGMGSARREDQFSRLGKNNVTINILVLSASRSLSVVRQRGWCQRTLPHVCVCTDNTSPFSRTRTSSRRARLRTSDVITRLARGLDDLFVCPSNVIPS